MATISGAAPPVADAAVLELRVLVPPPALVTAALVAPPELEGAPPVLPDLVVDFVPPLESAEPPNEERVPPLLESVPPLLDVSLVLADLVVVVGFEPPLTFDALDGSCSPPAPWGDVAVDLVVAPEAEPPRPAFPPEGEPGPFASEPQAMQRARQGRARVTTNRCMVFQSLAQPRRSALPQGRRLSWFVA